MAISNPYRPGAGHMPPHLAGRQPEIDEFIRLLQQDPILENIVLTGLRGVGKTVLLESWRPTAVAAGWSWISNVMSETASSTEENVAIRLLADAAVATSAVSSTEVTTVGLGFHTESTDRRSIGYGELTALYEATPGLASDKLAVTLEAAVRLIVGAGRRGVVFAYDEAQALTDSTKSGEHPLALLLHVFQSLQSKGLPVLLILAGLPTLYPKLVESRTYAERMFRVLFLESLDRDATHDAIEAPLHEASLPIAPAGRFSDVVYDASAGYPYFIQFICREAFDGLIAADFDTTRSEVPLDAIMRKLDTDFFAGRWARATDRQRDLLDVIAHLESAAGEFTVQEIVAASREHTTKAFSSSH
ncbi:MAG: AAA family ATPase, partial [Thermoleophilia bacterium]|nr:AAA family ATPase [Thermoleophilia bacterium]